MRGLVDRKACVERRHITASAEKQKERGPDRRRDVRQESQAAPAGYPWKYRANWRKMTGALPLDKAGQRASRRAAGRPTLAVMAGKLSPTAALRVAELESFSPKVLRLNTLVEQYAIAKSNSEQSTSSLKRAADQLKLQLMSVGLDGMSQICGTIALTAGRAGNPGAKTRALRELIGNLRFQLELSIRTTIREDDERRTREKNASEVDSADA